MRRVVALLVIGLAGLGAAAQPARPPGEGGSAGSGRSSDPMQPGSDEVARSSESRDALASEIAALKGDGPRLAAALVETGRRTRAAEERIAPAEERLRVLSARRSDLQRSLAERRDTVAEVLAALQRLNGAEPPAWIGQGDALLPRLRAALVLGTLVPDLQAEATRLAADLEQLANVSAAASGERALLLREAAQLEQERGRLAALSDARRARLSVAEASLVAERSRADGFGRSTRTLPDLSDALARGQTAAAPSAVSPPLEEEARRLRERLAVAAGRAPQPLAPTIAFAQNRGQLARPVSGTVLRGFGEPDPQGAPSRGLTIAARPGAVVTAVADGRVLFSGPFRSFGRLLIIDAGGGYYLVLAGMGQVSVGVGQSVLAGEPVGSMTGSLGPAASESVEAGRPLLYVEFRKDGTAIDPGPWWSKSQGEKVRG